MRFTTTLVMILVLAGIGLLIYLADDEEAPPPPPARSMLFPTVFFSGLERIELTMNLGRKAVLERDDTGRWLVIEPYRDMAREDRLQQLFAMLQQNERKRVSSKGSTPDLESKGLANPGRAITLHDGQAVHTVNIGIRDAMRSTVYVTFGIEKDLYTTGANILNFLEMNPEDLRDKRLFRIDPMIVNSARIDGPDGVIVDVVRKLGQWEIVAPVKDDGENSKVLSLINRLSRLQITSILPPAADPEAERRACGFDHDRYTFTLRSGSLSETVVAAPQVLGPQGAVYCSREGEETIVTIDRTRFTRIPLDLESYRCRALMPEVRKDVTEVDIRREGETWLNVRKDKGQFFSIKAPFEALADNVQDGDITPVSLFITKIFALRATDFVSHEAENLAEFGLDAPEWEIEVGWKPDPRARVRRIKLGFSAAAHGYCRVVRHDKPRFIYSIEEEELAFLEDDPLFLRDKRIFYQDIEYVSGARFVLGEKEFTIRRSESGVFGDDPDQRFQAFLHDMKRTMVVRYEVHEGGTAPDNDPRFEESLGSVQWFVDEPGKESREITAEFGIEFNDGFYGRISDMDRGVFVLEKTFIDLFRKLFDGI